MQSAGIEEKVIENIFNRFAKTTSKWHEFIDISFVPDEVKTAYHNLIDSKLKQIQLK
jgi:serine/threonine-protein kinase HipA